MLCIGNKETRRRMSGASRATISDWSKAERAASLQVALVRNCGQYVGRAGASGKC
jgi:hypothetical protein